MTLLVPCLAWLGCVAWCVAYAIWLVWSDPYRPYDNRDLDGPTPTDINRCIAYYESEMLRWKWQQSHVKKGYQR